MDKLRSILVKMLDSMVTLESILAEEIKQLSCPQINPVSLQVISDTKSQLLSTIGYYDEMRVQEEHSLNLAAPYEGNATFSSQWKNIAERIALSNDLNKQVAVLLDMHFKKNNDLKVMMNQIGSVAATYSSNGVSHNVASGKMYNISI